MCGRDYNLKEPYEIVEYLKGSNIPVKNLVQEKKLLKVNIPPETQIITLFKSDNDYTLETTNWGIKFSEKAPLIINSKIETIKEKDYWFNLFNRNRALIPLSGFYEWPVINGRKVMHKVYLEKSELFFAAALWCRIKDKICTSIITVPANEFMKDVHHRMPAIITVNQIKDFFKNEPEKNFALCVPYTGKDMAMEKADL
jgi:putative SOS response-associated peptidase YedK